MMSSKQKKRILHQYNEIRVDNFLCGLGDEDLPRFYRPISPSVEFEDIKIEDLRRCLEEEKDIRRIFQQYVEFDMAAARLEIDPLYSSGVLEMRTRVEEKLAKYNAQPDSEQKQ